MLMTYEKHSYHWIEIALFLEQIGDLFQMRCVLRDFCTPTVHLSDANSVYPSIIININYGNCHWQLLISVAHRNIYIGGPTWTPEITL